MTPSRRRLQLSWQTAFILGAGIILLQVLTTLTIIATAFWPLAQRSAEDLSGLLIMTAQTYEQLPPAARPVFLHRVDQDNGLRLGDVPPTHAHSLMGVGHIYGRLLSNILSQRMGSRVTVYSLPGPRTTFWVSIPVHGKAVWVHFNRRRLSSTLPLGVISVLAISTVALLILTALLVRRVLRPLAVLAEAVRRPFKAPLPILSPKSAREFAELLDAFGKMRKRLQAMVDHQSLLLVGISHDLRSPLARLQMALELLPPNSSPALREGMEQDIQRIGQLLSQSLAIGRGTTARMADLDLVALMTDVLQEFVRGGGVWTGKLPKRCPIRGDYEALHRLLGNVLDNVQRYGAGQVDVSIERRGGRKGTLRLCDHGPGIPEQELDKVLEPFYRGDDARGHGEGSGLGLAIARQIAEAQGMDLRLSNGPQGGLCMELGWEF